MTRTPRSAITSSDAAFSMARVMTGVNNRTLPPYRASLPHSAVRLFSAAAKSPARIAAFKASPARLRTRTDSIADEFRKARSAPLNTAAGSLTNSRTLWIRITSNMPSWNKFENRSASPCLVSIFSVIPASCAARFAISSIAGEESSSVT